MAPAGPSVAATAHEWVSFEDPDEDRTWVFDVTFLTSRWTCIYGRGCKGVLTEEAPELVHGCCSYGAHFVDKDDVRRVERHAARLTDEQWQFRKKAKRLGVTRTTKRGETVTRLVDGACIFLNRPGFPTGPGCALHQAALARGKRPLDMKPEVCWQLPLRREDQVADDGHVTSSVGQWDRRHWGAGGREFAWWCTEAPDAFVGATPVYEQMADELEAITGREVHRMLVAYLDDRRRRVQVPLPHPTLRVRTRP
jgi:hypothetical protein